MEMKNYKELFDKEKKKIIDALSKEKKKFKELLDKQKARKIFKSLIQNHIKKGYLRDISLKDDIINVPLYNLIHDDEDFHTFFVEDKPILCYYKNDEDLRTVSAPHMISIFLSMLELSHSDDVLILGAKGGFISAILSNIANYIYILEQHPEVIKVTKENLDQLGIKNVEVLNKNPLLGLPDSGPFNKILVTGAIKEIPDKIFDQLAIYGILVAPVITSNDKQQVIQFIKQHHNIQRINFGDVIFQELYYSKIKFTPSKRIEFSVRNELFTDTFAKLPKIQIVALALTPDFSSKTRKLKFGDPSYRIYCKIKNNDKNPITIQIKLEMPSVDKENISPKIIFNPNETKYDSIIIANPQRQGTHDFNLIICNEDNFRLAQAESCVEIKKTAKKKILEATLMIIKISSILI